VREPGADDDKGDPDEMVPLGELLEETKWQHALAKAQVDLDNLNAVGAASKHARPMFAPALDLWADSDDEPIDLVQGLIPERALTVQASSPKAGKTWIEEELVTSIATGTKAFNEFPTGDPRAAAMILCEDSRRATRNRLKAIATGKGLSHEEALRRIYLVCRPHFDLLNPADVAWIVASARMLPEPIAILVIDPLRDAWTGKETEEMDKVTRVLRQLVTLLDCAVFITHHNRKSSTASNKPPSSPEEEMRGGSELLGRLDAGIFPRRKGGDARNTFDLNVHTTKRDGQRVEDFDLRLEIEDENRRAKTVRWTVIRGTQGGNDERVLEALRKLEAEHPGDYHDIRAIARRAGLRESEASDTLSSLLFSKKAERGIRHGSWRAAFNRSA
jgi:hypothetical protein